MVNQPIHAPARARELCPRHAEMSWRTTLTVLTALTLVARVLNFRAYPDRPCSRAPLSGEGYFDAQHAKERLRAARRDAEMLWPAAPFFEISSPARLVAARRKSEAVPTQLPRSAAAFSCGGPAAGAVIERRFVLPHNAEINSRRTQEFLASFSQFDRIFMQLIVATGTVLTPAPRAVACFAFVPHVLPKRSRYFPSSLEGGADLAVP